MKKLFVLLALASPFVIGSSAGAMIKARPTKLQNYQSSNVSTIRDNVANQATLAGGPTANSRLNFQQLIDQVVPSVVEKPRVLIGTTNAERALGSTTFSLPVRRQNQRAELRASLRPNKNGLQIPMGVSSNPEAFHLDVNYVTAAPASLTSSIRLNYRNSHSTPDSVATRILTYDAPVTSSSLGNGRLVATVQQRADRDQGVWKTTATFIRFMPK